MKTSSERLESAKKNAKIDDGDSMKELFNAVANDLYLSETKKSFEELNEYLSYGDSSWTDGCTGDEWESIEDCIIGAEEAASQAIETEEEESKNKRLTAKEVIERAGLIDDETHHYMHVETGIVDTGAGWIATLEDRDPEFDSAFDPEGPGAGLLEVVKDESGDWVEKE